MDIWSSEFFCKFKSLAIILFDSNEAFVVNLWGEALAG